MTIVKLTQFTRLLYRLNNGGSYQIKRTYSDKILPASDYFTWNTANPVKLHIGKVTEKMSCESPKRLFTFADMSHRSQSYSFRRQGFYTKKYKTLTLAMW